MHYPDRAGVDCDVRQHSLHIPTSYVRTIPNHPNWRLGPIDNSAADTVGINNDPIAKFRVDPDTMNHKEIQFIDLSYYEPDNWFWEFGDGMESFEQSPKHIYDSPGTYEVCLTVSNSNSTNRVCRTIVIGTSSIDNVAYPDLSIFPNPTKGDFGIRLSEYIPENGELLIFSSTGNQVLKKSIYYGWSGIDINHLEDGIYVIQIMDGRKTIYTGKLIKQR